MEGEWLRYELSLIGRYHPCLSYITFMAGECPDEIAANPAYYYPYMYINVKAESFEYWQVRATPGYDW